MANPREELIKVFKLFDKEGKGYIDLADLNRAANRVAPELEGILGGGLSMTMIEGADRDHDGVVNQSDFLAFFGQDGSSLKALGESTQDIEGIMCTNNLASGSRQPKSQSKEEGHEQLTQDMNGLKVETDHENRTQDLFLQLHTPLITSELLESELKSIRAGFDTLGISCRKNTRNISGSLNSEQWRALVELHSLHLNEYYDFIAASQHPSTAQELRVESVYIQARLETFVTALKDQLPATRPHLLRFLRHAVSLLAVLSAIFPGYSKHGTMCLSWLQPFLFQYQNDVNHDQDYKLCGVVEANSYHGEHTISGEEVFLFQLQTRNQVEEGRKLYKRLEGGVGIPNLHSSYTIDGKTFLVADHAGPRLDEFLKHCKGSFSLKTTLLLAEQLITRVEYIHGKSLVHRNLTMASFYIGRGKKGALVYANCFRLEGKDLYSNTQLDLPYLESVESLSNNYHCIESSRCKDMQSLAHLLMRMTGEHRVPTEFSRFLNYTRNLGINQTPDYEHSREIFRELFRSYNFINDYVFDWTVRKYTKDGEVKKVYNSLCQV